LSVIQLTKNQKEISYNLFQWMMIDKCIKHTDAKTTYIIYPLLPHYQTTKIYGLSLKIYQHIVTYYLKDEFILTGDSAGALITISILHLTKIENIELYSDLN